MKRPMMSRRTVLRGMLGGAVVAIGLPPFEAMFRSDGRALADGTIPNRFGLWFFGNGIRTEQWIPDGTGASWVPREALASLEGVRPWLHILTGMQIKTSTYPHHGGMAGIMTGDVYQQVGTTRDTIVSTFSGPSLDQIAAASIGGATPYRSLELGITRKTGTDEGTTFEALSHNGPNSVNQPERSAHALFQRLFGAPPSPQVDAARRSVLDAVGAQTRALQDRIGKHDRVRLDQHLDSIRTLEKRLAAPRPACMVPQPPTDPDESGLQPIAEKNRLISDLLVMALTCDLTRVFSVMFSQAGSGVVLSMPEVGATEGLHSHCHNDALPQGVVQRAVVFTIKQLAYLLERMRDTAEGDGNLLDNSVVFATSELGDQQPSHAISEFPVLIAGKGGGRLRGNYHFRSPNGLNTSHAVFTALRAAGVRLDAGFGTGAGHVTSGVTEIEA
jgi:hypothetical protein